MGKTSKCYDFSLLVFIRAIHTQWGDVHSREPRDDRDENQITQLFFSSKRLLFRGDGLERRRGRASTDE
jgi:hypothetical protein